jgi:uncharacterized protein
MTIHSATRLVVALSAVAAIGHPRGLQSQEPVKFVHGPPAWSRPTQPVSFNDGEVRLSGVLLLPSGSGPFPAVVFAHGAGPATHDEPAWVLHANAFLSHGFAVLSYDKRGSGKSTGDLDLADYDDLANDLLASIRYLRTRPDIIGREIGILGRSEGGWVGPLAASQDPAIAFVIMSSGAALGPLDENLYWVKSTLHAEGATDSVVEQAVRFKRDQWAFYRGVAEGHFAGARAAAIRDSLLRREQAFTKLQPVYFASVMNPATTPRREFEVSAHEMYYDPGPILSRLQAPLLDLLGANDEVVDPSSTITRLEDLRAAGHDVTWRIYPGVDHTLVVMQGDQIVGYPDGYLDFLTDWATQRVSRRAH